MGMARHLPVVSEKLPALAQAREVDVRAFGYPGLWREWFANGFRNSLRAHRLLTSQYLRYFLAHHAKLASLLA